MAEVQCVEFFLLGKWTECRKLTDREFAENCIRAKDLPENCFGYRFFVKDTVTNGDTYSTSTFFGEAISWEEMVEQYPEEATRLILIEGGNIKRIVKTRLGNFIVPEPWDSVRNV